MHLCPVGCDCIQPSQVTFIISNNNSNNSMFESGSILHVRMKGFITCKALMNESHQSVNINTHDGKCDINFKTVPEFQNVCS